MDLTVDTWQQNNSSNRLSKNPVPENRNMAYTSVKMAWHRSKHMQSTCPYDAHNKCDKNDKSP